MVLLTELNLGLKINQRVQLFSLSLEKLYLTKDNYYPFMKKELLWQKEAIPLLRVSR